jgi:hypothetical protein
MVTGLKREHHLILGPQANNGLKLTIGGMARRVPPLAA